MFRKFIIHLTVSFSQIIFCQQGWYQLNSGTSQSFSSVFFKTADTGYVGGENGRIQKTTNGGINWVNQTSGTTYSLVSIFFVNDSTGYVLGRGNNICFILKTNNGGLNWAQQSCGTNYEMSSLYFVDMNTGYGCGVHTTVIKTTNSGTNWCSSSLYSFNSYILLMQIQDIFMMME
jgi:photosystem II stability/assembly factor-like uncharacterized protein